MGKTVCQSCGAQWEPAPIGVVHKCQCGAIMNGRPFAQIVVPLAHEHVVREAGFRAGLSREEIDRSMRVIPTARQSRADSAIEVALNIFIGATVSLAAQTAIFPAYGIHATAGQHVGIVAAFTVVSVARQYVLRRLCDGKSPYRYLKEKFSA